MQMKIVIVYELPQRELENNLLLKAHLEKKGHICDIIKYPFDSIFKLRNKYFNCVDAIFVQSMRNDNILFNLVYQVFGKVPIIIDMQVEQIGTNSSDSDYNSYKYPVGAAKYAYHICWGKYSYERLIEGGINKEKLLLTGPIQMDFLRNEFSQYYYSKQDLLEKYGIEKGKKICLFISSFSYVGLLDFERKSLKRIIGEDKFNSFERLSNESFDQIYIWIKKLLESHPAFVLIYRKHPAERTNQKLVKLSEEYRESFKLISDYSVKQWIVISDYIMTWYSTSVGEAFFANKKVLILRPIDIEWNNEVSILNGARKITSYDELLKALKEGSFNSLDRSMVMNFFDVDEEKPTYKRIGDELTNIINCKNNEFPWYKVDLREFKKREIYRFVKRVFIEIYILVIKLLNKMEIYYSIRLNGKLRTKIDNLNKEAIKKMEQDSEIERLYLNEGYFKMLVNQKDDILEEQR